VLGRASGDNSLFGQNPLYRFMELFSLSIAGLPDGHIILAGLRRRELVFDEQRRWLALL
jgi:hypothetical protein